MSEEQNQAVKVTPEDRARIARVYDAFEELQVTISAFQRYVQQPMATVCEYYWNRAVADLDAGSIVVVPQSELLSFNPEPENPDSGAQLLHLPGHLDRTLQNIEQYGTPMIRVVTPRIKAAIELLAVTQSDTTVGDLNIKLADMVKSIISELLKMQQDRPGTQLVATPLQGAVTMDSENPELLNIYMYVLVGRRNATTLEPI
jgi:hypothetical protein